jgi:hypothetical protein
VRSRAEAAADLGATRELGLQRLRQLDRFLGRRPGVLRPSERAKDARGGHQGGPQTVTVAALAGRLHRECSGRRGRRRVAQVLLAAGEALQRAGQAVERARLLRQLPPALEQGQGGRAVAVAREELAQVRDRGRDAAGIVLSLEQRQGLGGRRARALAVPRDLEGFADVAPGVRLLPFEAQLLRQRERAPVVPERLRGVALARAEDAEHGERRHEPDAVAAALVEGGGLRQVRERLGVAPEVHEREADVADDVRLHPAVAGRARERQRLLRVPEHLLRQPQERVDGRDPVGHHGAAHRVDVRWQQRHRLVEHVERLHALAHAHLRHGQAGEQPALGPRGAGAACPREARLQLYVRRWRLAARQQRLGEAEQRLRLEPRIAQPVRERGADREERLRLRKPPRGPLRAALGHHGSRQVGGGRHRREQRVARGVVRRRRQGGRGGLRSAGILGGGETAPGREQRGQARETGGHAAIIRHGPDRSSIGPAAVVPRGGTMRHVAIGHLAMACGLAAGAASAAERPWMDRALAPAARAALLAAQMTLDEKIAMVHGPGFQMDAGFAGTIPGNERLGIPSLRLADGPNGVGNGSTGVTAFPAAALLAASWDPALAERYGQALGSEQAGKGHQVALAPTVNILRVPHWGRAFETLSEDPYLAGRLAVAEIDGIESQGVLATVKHYAANNQETLRMSIDARVSPRALRTIYLPAFEAAVREAAVGSVMCSYNRINGTYGCEHPWLLTDVLRKEWGYEGFVMSDWFATHSTEAAANAGSTWRCPAAPTRSAGSPSTSATRSRKRSRTERCRPRRSTRRCDASWR